MEHRRQPVPQDIALASDVFDQFCNSSTLKGILGHHRQLCELLRIKPTVFPHFYPKLKVRFLSCQFIFISIWTDCLFAQRRCAWSVV